MYDIYLFNIYVVLLSERQSKKPSRFFFTGLKYLRSKKHRDFQLHILSSCADFQTREV